MLDQPHSGTGSASCGIGVLLTARDIFIGVRDFGWTFKEAPFYVQKALYDGCLTQ